LKFVSFARGSVLAPKAQLAETNHQKHVSKEFGMHITSIS
jgi:hypothetical protein